MTLAGSRSGRPALCRGAVLLLLASTLVTGAQPGGMRFEPFVIPPGYQFPSDGPFTLEFFDKHTATVLKPQSLPQGAVPVGKVTSSYGEVNAGQFEPETYRIFRQWITNETDYIGFGCGSGLLLLYAANIAHRAVGLDGDPVMQLLSRTNAAQNPRLPVVALPHCVAATPGTNSTFYAKHPGSTESSSESTYVDVIRRQRNKMRRTMMYKWTTSCLTIPEVIAQQRLRPPFFWKVDIEGYEAELVPAWEPWIRSMLPHERPTIFVQIHQWGGTWPAHQLAKWKHILATLYPYVYFVDDAGFAGPQFVQRVDAAHPDWKLCFPACSYILTNQRARGCTPKKEGFFTETCPLSVVER